jgi:hypothetical protein
MKYGTWSTAMAQRWDSRRRKVRLICGPETYKWRRLVTQVAFITQSRNCIVVVVPALGADPSNPRPCDILNAQLAALVVSKRLRWQLWRKSLALYLQYPNRCQVEVRTERNKALRAVDAYFSESKADQQDILPTSLLSYLLLNSN